MFGFFGASAPRIERREAGAQAQNGSVAQHLAAGFPPAPHRVTACACDRRLAKSTSDLDQNGQLWAPSPST